MEIRERREQFVKTYEQAPIFLLQGSVGERIKRNFTHQDPPRPLKLAGLYYSKAGHEGLEASFRDYIEIAQKYDLPLILHPYTSSLNGEVLKGTGAEGRNVSKDNVAFCHSIVEQYPAIADKVFVGTTLGFSGDPYKPETGLDEEAAYAHHSKLTRILENLDIDHARTGLTPSLPEAAGEARALADTTLPYFVSFLVKKDGCLLDGTLLNDAVAYIDEKTAVHPPLFYQVNCVHPHNMALCLDQPGNCTELMHRRFKGLEGNGSDLSPEDLDNSPVIHTSPADEWADGMMEMYTRYGCKVLGGCCGTDHAHLDELAKRIRRVWDETGAQIR